MDTKHRAEPWRVVRSWAVSGAKNDPLTPGETFDDRRFYDGAMVCESVDAADAARIVACVNACKGISNDGLQAVARGEKWLLCVKPTGERRRCRHAGSARGSGLGDLAQGTGAVMMPGPRVWSPLSARKPRAAPAPETPLGMSAPGRKASPSRDAFAADLVG
jgi:hypothetical protein